MTPEEHAALNEFSLDELKAELERRRVVLHMSRPTGDALIRIGCLLLARMSAPGERFGAVCSLAADFEHFARNGLPEAPGKAKEAPAQAYPPLTKANVMSTCRALLAAGLPHGMNMFDVCIQLEFNPTSFGSWACGATIPMPYNWRKLCDALARGISPPVRPNGVDPEPVEEGVTP